MPETETFDKIVEALCKQMEELPDHRTGKNVTYTLKDAALSAFAVFFTQSPSFLEYQRAMKRSKGRSNAESIFGIEKIPCDNQIRKLLDPIEPRHLFPMFEMIFEELKQSGELDTFCAFDDNLLFPFDGTQYFSSQKIDCQNCSHKTLSDGSLIYSHSVIIPVVVKPGVNKVIVLEPEFITPQDGHDKQDCEQEAAKRWVRRNAQQYATTKVTVLGDDLYCKQPFCELLLEKAFNFILVCKPDSHPALYDWLDHLVVGLDGGLHQFSVRHWNGRFGEIFTYRYAKHVPLRADQDTLIVNWCELTIANETSGEILYRNAFATNHLITRTTVAPIVRAGRARWKSENENHNVLKTKGYHLEHNYGHGEVHLASLLLTLNLLAFLFHTALDLLHEKYQLLRAALVTRKTFFDDIRALLRYHLFQNWNELLEFMFVQLELLPFADTN
jgi:hypothetical protein